MLSSYYKIQSIQEKLGTILRIIITNDGKMYNYFWDSDQPKLDSVGVVLG